MKYLLLLLFILLAKLSFAQTSCEACEGSINKTLTVSGGTPPTGYTVSYAWSGGLTGNETVTATAAGVYTATVTWSSVDCDDITNTWTFTVTENALPICSVSGGGSFCEGSDVTLTSSVSSGTAPFTYSWTGPNSFSSTLQSPTLNSITAAESGDYVLVITDSKGCEGVSCTANVIVTAAPTMTLSGTCN